MFFPAFNCSKLCIAWSLFFNVTKLFLRLNWKSLHDIWNRHCAAQNPNFIFKAVFFASTLQLNPVHSRKISHWVSHIFKASNRTKPKFHQQVGVDTTRPRTKLATAKMFAILFEITQPCMKLSQENYFLPCSCCTISDFGCGCAALKKYIIHWESVIWIHF